MTLASTFYDNNYLSFVKDKCQYILISPDLRPYGMIFKVFPYLIITKVVYVVVLTG